MKNLKEINNNPSITLEEVLFDEISFNRCGFPPNSLDNWPDPYISIERSVIHVSGNKYKVTTGIQCHIENQYDINIVVFGYFIIPENLTDKERTDTLGITCVSILYSYVREKFNALVSQPGVRPVIIHPINLKQVFKDSALVIEELDDNN